MNNNLLYVSTRNGSEKLTASQGILKGLANNGGLYLPEKMPDAFEDLTKFINMSYTETAFEILKLFYTDFTEEELKYCINNAYDEKFDTKEIAPIVKLGKSYVLELFHGKTLAFKDIALSILPYLLTTAAKKNNVTKKIVILTATSGDTGKAALEGFKDIDNTEIIVFYPDGGVSEVQRLQMVTTVGKNTKVCGVVGDFDDTQTNVKNIFLDKELRQKLDEKNIVFSSANSINIGRLFPQVVYYFYAYSKLVSSNEIKLGEKINFTVPTGNFGNILSGYVAKLLGLPIDKLICASNENKILYDFFKTGEYNRNRKFILTSSPSMDILISSNFERLIYLLSNAETTTKLFNSLNETGKFNFEMEIEDFCAEFATEKETKETIKSVYTKYNYVLDTHTAVAYNAYEKSSKTDKTKNVILATASPYKFPEAVCSSIDEKFKGENPFELFKEIEKMSGQKIPNVLKNIDDEKIMHNDLCDKTEMKKYVETILFKQH